MGVGGRDERQFHQTSITAVACGAFLPIETRVWGRLVIELPRGAEKRGIKKFNLEIKTLAPSPPPPKISCPRLNVHLTPLAAIISTRSTIRTVYWRFASE